jgi:hypothetical protein
VKIGPYHVVGPHDDDHEPDVLVLDTNVAIDIERFYFGRGGVDSAALRALLARFPFEGRRPVKMSYGWAVAEASYVRGRGVDPVTYRSLDYACETVTSWTPDEVQRAFADRRAPVTRDSRWPRKVALPREPVDPRVLLVAPYGALLMLAHLDAHRSTGPHRDGEALLREYVRWLTDELGVRQAYPMTLASGIFVGTGQSNESARRVLKISGAPDPDRLASTAWNAAWDVLLTSLGEGLTYGLAPVAAGRLHKIVTRNVDPINLRRDVEARVIVDTGRSRIPFVSSRVDVSKRANQWAVSEILEMDPIEAYRRHQRSPEAMLRQAASAVAQLEERVGVTQRLSFDGWKLGSSSQGGDRRRGA